MSTVTHAPTHMRDDTGVQLHETHGDQDTKTARHGGPGPGRPVSDVEQGASVESPAVTKAEMRVWIGSRHVRT